MIHVHVVKAVIAAAAADITLGGEDVKGTGFEEIELKMVHVCVSGKRAHP